MRHEGKAAISHLLVLATEAQVPWGIPGARVEDPELTYRGQRNWVIYPPVSKDQWMWAVRDSFPFCLVYYAEARVAFCCLEGSPLVKRCRYWQLEVELTQRCSGKALGTVIQSASL